MSWVLSSADVHLRLYSSVNSSDFCGFQTMLMISFTIVSICSTVFFQVSSLYSGKSSFWVPWILISSTSIWSRITISLIDTLIMSYDLCFFCYFCEYHSTLFLSLMYTLHMLSWQAVQLRLLWNVIVIVFFSLLWDFLHCQLKCLNFSQL